MSTSLGELVCRLNVLLDLDNLATRRLRRRKESKAEFLILARLYNTSTGSLQQSELADYLQIAPSHVMTITQRLAKRGLLKRHKAMRSSRTIIVSLTESGRTEFESSLKSGAREFALFDVVWDSPEERMQAIKLIEKVVSQLAKGIKLPGHGDSH